MGVALVAAILLVLSGVAEAQDAASVVNEDSQSANQNTGVTVPGGASESATRWVVKPGDSLWTIAREQLQPDATPEQIGYETERIIELNQNLLGTNPEMLLPGQELLLAPLAEPAAAAVEPEAAAEPTSPEPAAAAAEPAAAAAAAAEPVAAPVERFPTPNNIEQRRLLGLGILLLTFVVTILMVWKLPMRRPQSWKILFEDTYHPALPSGFEFTNTQARQHLDNLNSNGSSAASKPKLQRSTVTPTTIRYQSRQLKPSRKPRSVGKLRTLRTNSARRPPRQGGAPGDMSSTEVRRSLRHAVKTKTQMVAS
jgi:LysM domain